METTPKKLGSLLQLSENEQVILDLMDKHSTPVALAKHCSIPRPTVYITLDKLHDRGLVLRHKYANKVHWRKNSEENIENLINETKQYLLKNSGSQGKISISNNIQISIHKGQKQISKLLLDMIQRFPEDRMIMISGSLVADSWNRVLGLEKINSFNRAVKEVGMITELVTSKKWFIEQANLFGVEWAKDFEGRSTRVQNIDNKYLDYSSQIFILKNRVYLFSMEDEVIIEIKNAEIVKLLVSLTRFIQDHSEVFDTNALLREFIAQKSE